MDILAICDTCQHPVKQIISTSPSWCNWQFVQSPARIIRTLRRMAFLGCLFRADLRCLQVGQAEAAICIGPAPAGVSLDSESCTKTRRFIPATDFSTKTPNSRKLAPRTKLLGEQFERPERVDRTRVAEAAVDGGEAPRLRVASRHSNFNKTISGLDPRRSGGPQVPAPLEVKTCILPMRLRP